MSLQYDAEGMAFPDDFSFVPSEQLEAVILDTPKEWDPEEYALCEAAFAADYELSLLPKREEVFIDGEPPTLSEREAHADAFFAAELAD